MKSIQIIGLMSGSSLDGLDIACVNFEIDNNSNINTWETISTGYYEYDEQLKSLLQKLPNSTAYHLAEVNSTISITWSSYINDFILKKGLSPNYISSHGHTIFHYPEQKFTCQIGNGGIIAASTGVDTICDYRSQDIVLGGKGTPLAPIVEKHLYPAYNAFLNLGGIANISFHKKDNILGYDVCPCNQILNYYASREGYTYDENGKIAASGQLNLDLLTALNNIEYYKKEAPKSLDNSQLIKQYTSLIDSFKIRDTSDILCTFSEHIASQVYDEMKKEKFNNTPLLITGGGAYNTDMMNRFKKRDINITLPSSLDIDFKESILMSLLGLLRILETPNTISSVTGASSETIAGAIYKA